MTLTLRHTVIGGETAEGDYCVYEDGEKIGRIRKGVGLNGAETWKWHVNVHDPRRTGNGSEDTFERAKAAFRKSWERTSPPPN